VQTDDGLRYRLDDGTEHRSPSSAGKAAMDGVACNGWRFWSVEGTEKPKREPKAKADKPTKAKKEPAAKKSAKTKAAPKKKGAKGKSVPMASDASYGCGVCPETFPTQKKAVAHAMTHTT
jgi:type IV secretory pathway VirB10-like protein